VTPERGIELQPVRLREGRSCIEKWGVAAALNPILRRHLARRKLQNESH
jgi:hypothetical protein